MSEEKYRAITDKLSINGEWSYEVQLGATQKKIDAVCVTDEKVYLVEIKPKLDMSAVGQSLVYRYLFNKFYPFLSNKQVVSVVVANENDEVIKEVANKYEVAVVIVAR